MKFEIWQLVISALGGSAFTELIRFVASWKKDNVETEITLSGGWKDYADELKSRLDKLEGEYWPMKIENIQLKVKVMELETKLNTIQSSVSELRNN